MRKIFFVVASGGQETQRHFEDTIQTKRSVEEVRNYLDKEQVDNLENIYHGSKFIVWGSVPTPINENKWNKMEVGDVVLIYNSGRIRYIGEVAAKTRSKDLAKYFWLENPEQQTWELMYFIVNEQAVDVPIGKFNNLIGYEENFSPRGFSQINEDKVKDFMRRYGEITGVMEKLERGEEILPAIKPEEVEIIEEAEEKIARAPTEHDEMQWRLIRLGRLANLDVWIPRNDQHRKYNGNTFKEYVIDEFQKSMDVPKTIENIDVVWKFGPYSIKSAFEIEHSTSIYSGILRLSDLRVETPNSVYPLFIVADKSRKTKVIQELNRPTFSSPALRLNEVVKYIDYERIRDIDNQAVENKEFDPELILAAAESP